MDKWARQIGKVRTAIILMYVTLSSIEITAGETSPCASIKCRGKWIHTHFGELDFCIPRGMKITKQTGVEGDVHYNITIVNNRIQNVLSIVYGAHFNAEDPTRGIEGGWLVQTWKCRGLTGSDYSRSESGVRSRYIGLPLGWAEYHNIPEKIANEFDKIFDSLCCGEFSMRKDH